PSGPVTAPAPECPPAGPILEPSLPPEPLYTLSPSSRTARAQRMRPEGGPFGLVRVRVFVRVRVAVLVLVLVVDHAHDHAHDHAPDPRARQRARARICRRTWPQGGGSAASAASTSTLRCTPLREIAVCPSVRTDSTASEVGTP